MTKIEIDKRDLAARDKKITELEKKLSNMQSGGNQSQQSFSSEDREALDDYYEPISRLVAQAVSGITNQIGESITGIRDSIDELKSNVEDQNQSLFSGVASTALKSYDDVRDSDEFKTFLEDKIKGVGVTWGDSWESARKDKNISVMQEIIDSFLETESGQELSQGRAVKVDDSEEGADQSKTSSANIEPKGGASSEINANSSYKYKVSEMVNKMEQFKLGKISDEDLTKFEEKFEEAHRAGEVLDDMEVQQQ